MHKKETIRKGVGYFHKYHIYFSFSGMNTNNSYYQDHTENSYEISVLRDKIKYREEKFKVYIEKFKQN